MPTPTSARPDRRENTHPDGLVIAGTTNRVAMRHRLTETTRLIKHHGLQRKEAVDVLGQVLTHQSLRWINRHFQQLMEGDPTVAREIQYADPTGEQAVHRLLCTAEECDRCGRSTKKNDPETVSAKTRLEAA